MTKNRLRRHLKLLTHRTRATIPLIYPFLVIPLLIANLALFAPMPASPSQLPTTSYQLPTTTPAVPAVTAARVFITNPDTGQVLYQKNADDSVAPASTTKLMTALDLYPLDYQITVDSPFTEGQDIGLTSGETITVEQLIYAMLIQSGNDAAEMLARAASGGREAFITAMNTKAQKLYLHHSSFKNPTGLDEAGHYSSATDLSRLASSILKNQFLRRIVASENAVVTSHILTNTNRLLSEVPGVLGIKTGFTANAGEALVTYVERPTGKRIIVVMGSQDRFTDTKTLIDWSYSNN
jgi:D-alanyl-D-alanine carboxypeptidase